MTSQVTRPAPGIAGYVLGRRLGSGATSDVFAATDPQGRAVAVKLLRGGIDSMPGAPERFAREVRLARALDHPHLVRLYDAGWNAGVPYLVMELLTGSTVEGLIARHPRGVPVADLVRVARQVALALVALHDAGLVHRDVKPANLFVAAAGVIKLGDFGLLREVVDLGQVTLPGHVLGTPHFMAPEQACADAIDGRADLYGLAATLYLLATGRPTCSGVSPWAVLDELLHQPFPDPRRLRPDLPAEVAELIVRAGARVLGERHPHARALLADLDRLDGSGGRRDATASAASRPVGTEAMPRLLLVDDDPLVRRIYIGRFHGEGFAPVAVGSAAAAREELARGVPALVVLDLLLPDGSGLDLLRELRARPETARMPVLVLSNAYDERLRASAREAGASAVVAKSATTPNQVLTMARHLVRAPAPPAPVAAAPARVALGVPELPQFLLLARAALARLQAMAALLRPGDEPARNARVLGEAAQALRGLSGSAAAVGRGAAAALAAALEILAGELAADPARLTVSSHASLRQALARIAALVGEDAPEPRAWPTPPVLLVDDDPLAARLMQAAVARAGLASAAVADGLAALERLRSQPCALILTDLVMPGLGGERFVQRVRELPAHRATPVIVVSALASFAAQPGCDAIAKPYLGIELTVKVLTALAGIVATTPPRHDPWQGAR